MIGAYCNKHNQADYLCLYFFTEEAYIMTKRGKGSGNNTSNTIWIHQGEVSRRVKPDELESYLSNGWELKRAPSFGKKMSVKIHDYFQSFTPEERSQLPNNYWNWKPGDEANEIKSKISSSHKETWSKKPDEEKKEFGRVHVEAWNNKSEEEQQEIINKRVNTVNSDPAKKVESNKKRSETLLNKTNEEKGIWVSKIWLTKKKNNTTNTSKPEQMLYEKLLNEYEGKTIYREYKCERYPYHCDFYIVEDDLFIELNAHWTHGGRPYDPNDYSCQKQLELWQEKAKTSKYVQSAIYTWTVRDVEKAECAKRNNLNYWVIY